tara:strand:+ start:409 stop:669 length:261 start_codon:yes stop_codon:yes gene_type:complete
MKTNKEMKDTTRTAYKFKKLIRSRQQVILDFMEHKYPSGVKVQESFSDEYQVDYQASLSEYKHLEGILKGFNNVISKVDNYDSLIN